jgi:hypothetical protein
MAASAKNSDMFKLSSKRFVSVKTFRNKTMIDIREYYIEKESGELKPTKKGILLPIDQWSQLKSIIDTIDAKIAATL